MDEVPVCRSESEEVEEGSGPSVPAKKSRRNKSWVLIKRWYSVQAKEFINNENIWSINYTRDSDEGEKSKGPQYDCALYLLFVNDCKDILIFKTNSSTTMTRLVREVSTEFRKTLKEKEISCLIYAESQKLF